MNSQSICVLEILHHIPRELHRIFQLPVRAANRNIQLHKNLPHVVHHLDRSRRPVPYLRLRSVDRVDHTVPALKLLPAVQPARFPRKMQKLLVQRIHRPRRKFSAPFRTLPVLRTKHNICLKIQIPLFRPRPDHVLRLLRFSRRNHAPALVLALRTPHRKIPRANLSRRLKHRLRVPVTLRQRPNHLRIQPDDVMKRLTMSHRRQLRLIPNQNKTRRTSLHDLRKQRRIDHRRFI